MDEPNPKAPRYILMERPPALCPAHFDKLQSELRARGLGPWFPTSEEDARTRAEAEAIEHTQSSFDPLNGAIVQAYRMSEETVTENPHFDPDGKRWGDCMICFQNKRVVELDAQNAPDTFDPILEWAAEDTVGEATKRGLLGSA